ncbi:hypothetical protein AOL_s00097g58 [Orbilia oligospora ATCC 24927]|uniref:F-box domain-containing protein n=1 Tax=Arthrobotrys oligospora (strain ATCC 24927 / CBS 115.81 / DSM 1491) TaxID=756982 RepID=G1XI81_ARTOA|nr:hypothetical protein AOL_s00097g58 [Orbilia oligospora ATCC 24927]EGX47012.1 hypothetical protein AOL_s00097g58 [Orbilia oligospora ATCC 24927]
MVSLTDLAAQPETLYMIVEYLSSNDIFSLMQSCKEMYPVCQKELWTTIALSRNKHLHSPNRNITRLRYQSFKDLVRMHGRKKLFFQYTKNLVLDGLIRLKYFKKTDIGKIFCQVLQSGELRPRTLAVAIGNLPEGNGGYTDYDGGYGSERRLKLLDCLKEYGKGKNLREFSVSIRASCLRQLPVYFNLSQVTQLDLNPNYNSIRRDWKAGKANKRTDRQIEELTTLLDQTPNLKQLIMGDWLRNHDQFRLSTRPRVKKEWKKLQRTIKSLQNLKTLKVVTYLFHPSLFLIPPPSVTNLLCTGTISPVWWRSFAVCEGLGNVRHLTIQVTDSWLLPESTLERGAEAPQIRDINLGNFAISGLQEFNAVWCHHDPKMYFRDGNPEGPSGPDRRNIPADLEDCIVRKNDNLSEKCLVGLLTPRGMIKKEEEDDEWW